MMFASVEGKEIEVVAEESLKGISNIELQVSIKKAMSNCSDIFAVVQDGLKTFSSGQLSTDELSSFFRCWRDTHFTAEFTARVAAKLNSAAAEATDAEQQANLLRAAQLIDQITNDDLGERNGDDHGELFEKMANFITRGQTWKSATVRSSAAERFRAWADELAMTADVSAAAVVCILAFELYHRGECNLAATCVQEYLIEQRDLDDDSALELAQYPIVHSLPGDLHNVGCAGEAVCAIYRALGQDVVNAEEINNITSHHFGLIESVFNELNSVN